MKIENIQIMDMGDGPDPHIEASGTVDGVEVKLDPVWKSALPESLPDQVAFFVAILIAKQRETVTGPKAVPLPFSTIHVADDGTITTE